MQARHGRRGFVFSVRVTDEERAQLEAMQAKGGGPRSLGPWMLWAALSSSRLRGYYPDGGVVPELRSSRYYLTCTPRARVVPARSRIILDLCAGSGSWSDPYRRAGYKVVRVSLPKLDVRTFVPPKNVWGVLAAPPCDQFSLARNGHTDTPRDFVRGLECVNACLRIILQCRPQWWALENPVGLLSKWLGTPRDVFEPCDFGDPWTKRTALWGDFAIPERGPFVRPKGGGPLCDECDPKHRKTTWCRRADHRAKTAPGFARAFFQANR